MALNKVNYVDNQTIISANNLNDIQDEIISLQQTTLQYPLKNLLINGDFSKPVNQNNQTKYEGARYGIDKWKCTSSNWNVSIKDGYIKYSSDTPANSTGMLQQIISITPNMRGKTVTLAAKVKGDYVRLNINNTSIGTYYKDNSNWTTLIKTGTIPTAEDTFFVALQNNKGDAIEGFSCEWIALYEGTYTIDTLPEYQPKGYENELLACRQYDPSTGEYIGLRKFSQPKNLLDNSDFTNLVAQAEILGKHGTATYFADRWVCSSNPFAYVTNSRSITFPASESPSILDQVIATNISGKTVTFVVKASAVSGNVYLSDTNAQSGHKDIHIQEGITTYTFVAGDNTCFRIWGRNSGTVTVDWVACYEGEYTLDTLPEYQPKGYGAELAECQRYYLNFNYVDASGFVSSGAKSYYMDIYTPVPMRKTPTVSMTGYTARISNGYSVHTGSNFTAPASLSVWARSPVEQGQLTIIDTIATAVDTNNSNLTYMINKLELSADL